jgi:hypothetical protein
MIEPTKAPEDRDVLGHSLARLHSFFLGSIDVILQDGANPADMREALLTVAITSKVAAEGPQETISYLKGVIDLLQREAEEMEQRRAEARAQSPRH